MYCGLKHEVPYLQWNTVLVYHEREGGSEHSVDSHMRHKLYLNVSYLTMTYQDQT